MSNKLSVEGVLIYNNYILYTTLNQMTQDAFAGSTATKINVYLDMYSMMNDLYQSRIEIQDYSIITSCICNLCSHIRTFYNHIGVDSTIYIVYSDNTSANTTSFMREYNSGHRNIVKSCAKMQDTIERNINLLKLISPYLDRVYFKTGTVEPSAIILDLINRNDAAGNTNPNIIFSRDIMSFQIPSLHGNSVVFMKSGNNAYSVTTETVISAYLSKTHHEMKPAYEELTQYPSTLGLLIALTNMPNRSVKSLYNINVASNIILTAINNRYISPFEYNPSRLYEELSKISFFKIDRFLFEQRFKALSLYYQNMIYTSTAECQDMTWMVDLHDPDSLKMINTEYFKNNPINLEVI